MRLSFHESAGKHGYGPSQLAVVWRSGAAQEAWLDNREPRRLLRIGFDQDGSLVEVVGLVFDDQRVLVIHAMPARKVSMELVAEARRGI